MCAWCCAYCENDEHDEDKKKYQRGKQTRLGCHHCYIAWKKWEAEQYNEEFVMDPNDINSMIFLCYDCHNEWHDANNQCNDFPCK